MREIIFSKLNQFCYSARERSLCVCVCVCECERERERENLDTPCKMSSETWVSVIEQTN